MRSLKMTPIFYNLGNVFIVIIIITSYTGIPIRENEIFTIFFLSVENSNLTIDRLKSCFN